VKCPHINPTIVQCNKCPFPDCIRDTVSLEERKLQSARDLEAKSVGRNYSRNSNVIRHRRYYQENPQKEIERVKRYQKEHSDEVNAYQRAYREANLERVRELERTRDKARRARKKAERVS
jgi:hypothetical protein